ncbi:hypothetical protein NPIL_64811 [Nephila pilipes]|uniref:Uncharacterized protein n=1 Tax=Nephila pilipes TaxID=299642 RepID=A0A8X6NGC9_NEPPI|nr:hypothetical protein NPIL_64811 [Nephila pilipes]
MGEMCRRPHYSGISRYLPTGWAEISREAPISLNPEWPAPSVGDSFVQVPIRLLWPLLDTDSFVVLIPPPSWDIPQHYRLGEGGRGANKRRKEYAPALNDKGTCLEILMRERSNLSFLPRVCRVSPANEIADILRDGPPLPIVFLGVEGFL